MAKTAVVIDRRLVSIGTSVGWDVFNDVGILVYGRVVFFQDTLYRFRTANLSHDPVRGAIAGLLYHALHVTTAFRAIDEIAFFNLVKKGRCYEGFDQTCRLELYIFIDGDKFLTGGEIVNCPTRTLISRDLALPTKFFNVILQQRFQFL